MRVNPKPRSAYPWYLRPFFWNQRRKYGAVLEPALLWARIPRLFLGIAWLNGALERRRSPLPGGLRALVSLRISQLNWCRFCIDMNSATLLKRGISQERLEALEEWRPSHQFDARERAALAYAEAISAETDPVDKALVSDLRRHFDDDGIVELTAHIAFQILSSKFNAALDIPSQGLCQMPGPGQTAKPGSDTQEGQKGPGP